jgi:A/G-specific adenine glycosylase
VTAVTDPPLAAVLEWWDRHRRPLPWRASRDVYAIWVSEVMSAQTTVGRAAEAWERWITRWPTVESLAAASLADVLALWQGLGYPRRARDLHRSARIVARSGWPQDLTALPGVGVYVASAIRCFALEEPVLPRDVNVRRVLERRFPDGVDIAADPWRAGQALMEFGQRVCAVRPRCEVCPVRAGCRGAGSQASPGPRPARRQKPFEGSLRQRRGRLLRQVIAEGSVAAGSVDAEAADGLVADCLVVREGDRLRAPV